MSKGFTSCFAAVALAGMATGCVLFQKTPSEKAASVVKMQCEASETPQTDAQLIQSLRVLSVEPKLMATMSNGGGKVVGTKLVVRPPEGVTSDRMTRVLQCHGARAFLGRPDRAVVAHDPTFLPDAWVSIEVSAEDGNYTALLSTDTVEDNLRVLRIANEFAAVQRSVPAPASPASP